MSTRGGGLASDWSMCPSHLHLMLIDPKEPSQGQGDLYALNVLEWPRSL